VISARYAGPKCSPEDNINLLLTNMKNISNRQARFRTCITLILNNEIKQFEGAVMGKILTEKRGTKGFGYDPVFVPDGYNITFAELNIEEKNKISHRGKAVAELVNYLNSIST
jgi:XTP/dITP diphosphohydrolase